jgi:hypothetical protein
LPQFSDDDRDLYGGHAACAAQEYVDLFVGHGSAENEHIENFKKNSINFKKRFFKHLLFSSTHYDKTAQHIEIVYHKWKWTHWNCLSSMKM